MRKFIGFYIVFKNLKPKTLQTNMVFKKWLNSSKTLIEKWMVENFLLHTNSSQKVEFRGVGQDWDGYHAGWLME